MLQTGPVCHPGVSARAGPFLQIFYLPGFLQPRKMRPDCLGLLEIQFSGKNAIGMSGGQIRLAPTTHDLHICHRPFRRFCSCETWKHRVTRGFSRGSPSLPVGMETHNRQIHKLSQTTCTKLCESHRLSPVMSQIWTVIDTGFLS